MREEVSKLKLENQELRENPTIDANVEASAEVAREWEEKCAKLKLRVRELKEANAKLKESRFSKADMKALVKEVESLTNQVLEKDMQLQALRKRGLKSSSASAAATGSRRSKDLLLALQVKEDKIMVLNDHLTGLMTENMRLQHSTEQYAIQFGPWMVRPRMVSLATQVSEYPAASGNSLPFDPSRRIQLKTDKGAHLVTYPASSLIQQYLLTFSCLQCVVYCVLLVQSIGCTLA